MSTRTLEETTAFTIKGAMIYCGTVTLLAFVIVLGMFFNYNAKVAAQEEKSRKFEEKFVESEKLMKERIQHLEELVDAKRQTTEEKIKHVEADVRKEAKVYYRSRFISGLEK